ncbi:hypothetical protein J2S30_001562 [Herbaspirillum rubrisubalbicans]|uniref:P-loop ATPase, Sll1717 family n=1 Tax=Herbaspirillum rubrisubalbicans TaxID=80842 RepID=UPI0020A105BA|nr:hypothetical protein [Herbaspirillum rubrisubalbicans]MCP1573183.1 hypothetical protein [Herbaspirillum rubrisubalbicans]
MQPVNNQGKTLPTFVQAFGFNSSPFQEYVAENEPYIDAYAVKPLYFRTVADRAQNSASFVLFGARGAGKSATRLTVYKELWTRKEKGEQIPLPVTLTDFNRILQGGLKSVDQGAFIRQLGFSTIEALLVWLGSLEEQERTIYVEGLTEQETDLVLGLLQNFYLTVGEINRSISTEAALQLLGQAWNTKAVFWIQKRWDSLAGIVSALITSFTKNRLGTSGTEESAIKEMLASLGKTGSAANDYSVALLRKFVQVCQVFGFSGLVILADKLDETEHTSRSAEATAKFVFPLLSQVQLLEIKSLGWIFFLWDKVKDYIASPESGVRLDKIAHASIEWDKGFLEKMINKRLEYFSNNTISSAAALLDKDLDADATSADLIKTAMGSPRELIRLWDTVIREHDNSNADADAAVPLSRTSIDTGTDKYVMTVIHSFYDDKVVRQFARLGHITFTNKEVQAAFKIGPNSARRRIQDWTTQGIVKHTGTRAAEGDGGGKPNSEYSVMDQRVARIIERKLIVIQENDNEDEPTEAEQD